MCHAKYWPSGANSCYPIAAQAICLLLGLAGPSGAAADIYMADDGVAGVTLTNQPMNGGYSRILKEEAPAASALTAEPVARQPPLRGKRALSVGRAELLPLVATAASVHGLPEALLHAVIQVESNFNPQAVSPRGAVGLMQLTPATARHLGVDDARDPAANIDGGARYLKTLLTLYRNDVVKALAAYNAGPGAVNRHGGEIPPYEETRRYVPKVLAIYHALQSGNTRVRH